MNISVDGNSNNVAGRDLVFNKERPFQESLLEELTVKRNLKYANWKKYSDQRDAVKNWSPLSFRLVVVFGFIALILFLFFGTFSLDAISQPQSGWVAVGTVKSGTPLSFATLGPAGLIAILVLAGCFIAYISKSSTDRENEVARLTKIMVPLAKEINDLDTEIEALMNLTRQK